MLLKEETAVHPGGQSSDQTRYDGSCRSREQYEGQRISLSDRQGQWFATPLLVVLLTVESTDVIFAVDSVPAIFAVTY